MKDFREIKNLDELIKNSKELTTEARKDLPKSDFVFPEEEKYPINDSSHAQNALSRVEQYGTPAEKAKVKKEVKKKYPDMDVKANVQTTY